MKIAILNAFPNLAHSAEKEFIRRAITVFDKFGHKAISVFTSDDISSFDPDFVLITHEFAAKLTDHFTVGLLWSPTQFYKNDTDRIKAIRSWDLIIPINDITRTFAKDIHFPMRHTSAVSDLYFYPSAPILDLPTPDADKLSLAYVGVHWDGARHKNLLAALADAVDLNIYGPPKAWEHMPNQYRGSLPFDGESVIRTLNRHGAVLALHKAAHVEEGTPSMRVFEGCAAKSLIFTEPMQQLVDIFGDTLQYVEPTRSPRAAARAIADTLHRYRKDPRLLAETLGQANVIFQSKVCLERLLSELVEEVKRHRASLHTAEVNQISGFDVTVIIRCGSRPLAMVQRAVASVQKQVFRRIGIVFARHAEIEGFDEWLEVLQRSERFQFVTDLRTRGGGVRSIAMWDGLRAVRTELFCMLDDDDELFSTHFSELVEVLRKNPDVDIAYTGVIRQEEDGVFFNKHERFKGDMGQVIPERRKLQFFSDYNLDRLLRFDNYIQSNAWMARSCILTPEVLDDPEMEVSEDMYFYILLASRYQFRFSGTVSAIWNWRSRAVDNSMAAVSQQRWANAGERLVRRAAQLEFPGGQLGRDVVGRGLSGRVIEPPEFSFDSIEPEPNGEAGVGVEDPKFTEEGVQDRYNGPAKAGQNGRRLRVASLGSRWMASLKRLTVPSRGTEFGRSPELVSPADELDLCFCVDFRAERLPSFIADVHGLSGCESWGRWTVGPRVRLQFRTVLPRFFTLEIWGHAFLSNHLQPVTIQVGQSKAFLKMDCKRIGAVYRVDIDNSVGADSIIFNIPNPQAPSKLFPQNSDDDRSLGIGLVRLGLLDAESQA